MSLLVKFGLEGHDGELPLHEVFLGLTRLVSTHIDTGQCTLASLGHRAACKLGQSLVQKVVHSTRAVDFNIIVEKVCLVTLAQATAERER